MSVLTRASFVGRSRELATLRDALSRAREGAGGLWFVRGEAGIGKSRLVEELAREATDLGVGVAWGRCWEGGGAPAFWPFIQLLRTLLRELPAEQVAAHAARLGQLLPELAPRGEGERESAPADAERARFQLMDAAASVLSEAAHLRPRLLVLEDLHAADASSLTLLDFVESSTHGVGLLLVGTYRDAQVARLPAGPLLERLSSRAHTLALPRLGRQDVAGYLASQGGGVPEPALVDAVFDATEGHPLFLVETGRLLTSRAAMAAGEVAVPRSVKNAIRERIGALSEDVRDVLAVASVMGREPSRELIASVTGRAPGELAVPLAEAIDADLLHETTPGCYRFSHVLIREVLEEDLPASRREALHADVARALSARDGRVAWSELAHHYLLAGSGARGQAVDALRRAAEHALSQLAFEEAVELYSRALSTAAGLEGGAAALRFELLLGRGHAQQLSGRVEAGRESCFEAVALARDAGEPEWLARAALAWGSLLVFASIDAQLIALLREALERLGDAPTALRARVMARLAAALQPQVPPEPPMQLAREAIALAREVGDRAALLEVIRNGCSSMIDIGDAAERLALDQEHAKLAAELREPVELLRAHSRMACDYYELGDILGARAAIEAAREVAAGLDHPNYAWRVAASSAVDAAWSGRFAEADAHLWRAWGLADAATDPNAESALLSIRVWLHSLRGEADALYALLPAAERALTGSSEMDALASLYTTGRLAEIGLRDEARARRNDSAIETALGLSDRTTLGALSHLCHVMSDAALAERVLERVVSQPSRWMHGGMLCMSWDRPVGAAMALLEHVRGEHTRADRLYEDALAQTERLGARPHQGWIALEYARQLAARDARPDRVRELVADATRLAGELELPAMADAAARLAQREASQSPPARPAPSAVAPPALRLERHGELWRLDAGGDPLLVKDSKGMGMLARLIAEPGREFHVLDLASPYGAADAGDAGVLVDAQARAAYQARLAELQSDLDEAEADNDLGRAERAREELDALGRELSRAVGLGNRERRAGSAAERARVNVQRRLRDAIRRIEQHQPRLGKHLDHSVRTGTFCSYDPG